MMGDSVEVMRTFGFARRLPLGALLVPAALAACSEVEAPHPGRNLDVNQSGSAGLGGASGAAGTTSGAVSGTGTGGSAGTAGSLGKAGSSGAGSGSGGAAGAGGAGTAGIAGMAGGGAGGATAGAGTGGAGTGGAGAGGTSPMGPTPPSATSKFPFPQNRRSSHCTYPTNFDNQDVLNVYQAWKTDLVTSDGAGGFQRVKRPREHGLNVNSTVSEGIAYGMMIAVYMDDQPLFDDLWKYSLAHSWTYSAPFGGGSTPTVLMNWYILEDGNVATEQTGGLSGSGAATDADEDMAWALVMAHEQWGGSGSLSKSYLDSAKQLLGDIWTFEIDQGRLPKNGSSWGSDRSLNISYFAPSYYRVFAEVSGQAGWGSSVVDYVYMVIASNLNATNGNQDNGLVPAWSQSNGTPAEVGLGEDPLPFTYQYDSCRTPFRIGIDACFHAEARAISYVGKTSQFFNGKGASGIVDGYQLNGTENPQFPDEFGGLSAAFIGPAAVGAMHSPNYQAFLDAAYALLKQNNLWCGGQYYDESWTLLSMLVLTGNFLDYTQYR